jgi:hypothetical protein
VAYREVSDPAAQADAALIKAAYQDAEKKASDLASATGAKLGKLVALTDYRTNQPYYKGCVEPQMGKPVPQGAPGAGSAPGAPSSVQGSTGTTVAPGRPVIACPANDSNHFLVVWVYIRHAIG